MGLPLNMDNMHAPTIPSGPRSNGAGPGVKTGGLSLRELQAKKDSMEAEIKALSSILDSQGVNMQTPLTTPDGFPRADLDVAQIRTVRSRIIYLRNDYKDLMNVIEKHVHEQFAILAQQNTASAAESISTHEGQSLQGEGSVAGRPVPVLEPAFAKVDSIVAASPADEAGLKVGDEIRNFGYVNRENNDSLRRVADCVQGNEGHVVLVKVSRSSGSGGRKQELQLNLIPRRNWGGRGLLGCHILPL